MKTVGRIRAMGMSVAMALTATGCATTATENAAPAQQQFWVYIGNGGTEGIGLYKLDTEKGSLESAGMAAPANKPGFLTISPDQKLLVAGVMTKDAKPAGGVQSFAINAATGKLTPLNVELSEGDEPCYVAIDPAGKNVLSANYGTATVSVVPIGPGGTLGKATSVIKEAGSSVDPARQTHAYAHSINVDPSGKFAISCDLGADKLFIYNFDSATGKLSAHDSVATPPGSGPRHLTFHPNGKYVYALNEMGATVIGYKFDPAKGSLTQFQVIKTLKNDEKGNTSAEVQIDPSGRFLYASNRLTTNYLTIYSIDQATGQLTLVGHQDALGKTPRNYRIDPTGHFMVLANQESDTLVLFKIDQTTGKLTPLGAPIPTVHGPICVKFVPVAAG